MAYHFTTRDDFKSLVDQGAFIEHAEFGGNLCVLRPRRPFCLPRDAEWAERLAGTARRPRQ